MPLNILRFIPNREGGIPFYDAAFTTSFATQRHAFVISFIKWCKFKARVLRSFPMVLLWVFLPSLEKLIPIQNWKLLVSKQCLAKFSIFGYRKFCDSASWRTSVNPRSIFRIVSRSQVSLPSQKKLILFGEHDHFLPSTRITHSQGKP